MKTYEGMFLLDAGIAEFETASEPIRQVLGRIEAEILNFNPWDERRLAYPIKGRKRGLYVLTYFKADPARMTELDHEVNLSEGILRAMVFSADHANEDVINAETPATLQRARRAAAEARKAEEAAAASAEPEAAPVDAEAVAAEVLAETPVEAPAEPAPAEEAPAEEAPAKEAPAEEAPAKEAPAEGAPATEDDAQEEQK